MTKLQFARYLIITLACAGCQILPDHAPVQAVYDFGPAQGENRPAPVPWCHVSVEAPDWLQDRLIRFRLVYAQPNQIRFYSQVRWVAPPPDLLANRLGAGCSDSHVDLGLELQRFEQIFDRPEQSTVVLQVQAHAVDVQTSRTLGVRSFCWSRATASGDATGAVAAFSSLVVSARSELSAWVASLPVQDSSSSPPAGRR